MSGGITPAYAGKRACTTTGTTRRKDHPRVCGEKRSSSPGVSARSGSPPRMRGKDSSPRPGFRLIRITPAYAGKSTPGTLKPSEPWDHPHMCGEKLRKTAILARELGSPPHVRGKAQTTKKLPGRCRITPACAGKSFKWEHFYHGCRDHPRMCGEKLTMLFLVLAVLGSPPHVRGKGGSRSFLCGSGGITPACAGKSLNRYAFDSFKGDHPRMCGEKQSARKNGRPAAGSPPHVRGKD